MHQPKPEVDSFVVPAQCTRKEIHFLFTNIFANTPISLAVAAIDDGRLLEANETFLNLIEYDRDSAVGRTTVELGMWPDLLLRNRRKNTIRTQGGERSEELTIRCRSGHLKEVLLSSQLIAIDGRSCVLGVGVDITSRKSAEIQLEHARQQAESASRSKSEFLATVSHEIRTPLTAILGLSELMRQKTRSLPQHAELFQKFLNRIQKNTSFVIELVSNILDLSKIEAKKFEVNKNIFEVGAYIAETLESLNALAQTKHLKFEVDLARLGTARVFTDPLRLRQIITNIVGNAIKFTGAGSIHISATLVGPPARRGLEVVVTDTGCGIHPRNHRMLFQSFKQLDGTSSRRFGGSGLGLYLSRRLARLLGGDVILVESAEGQGSTFRIVVDATLPSAPKNDVGQTQTESALAPVTDASPSGRKILLIEDNLDIQFAVKEILAFEGFDIDVASDGRDSIALIMNKHYDVVLMDMHMPDLNGIDTTKTLRQMGFTGKIVAFSAAVQKEDQELAIQAGCNSFLCKPFEIDDLIQAVSEPSPHR